MKFNTKFNTVNLEKNKVLIISLIIIFLLAFSIRSIPAKYNEFQALDPFFIYHVTEMWIETGFNLPPTDMIVDFPIGGKWDLPLATAFPALIYLLVNPLLNIHLHTFALYYPAFMGALAALIMFFIGKEMFNKKTGLAAAFFTALMPGFILRTSAGFFEKEPTIAVFMVFSFLFFIKSYKSSSVKYSILSGVFLAASVLVSGIAQVVFLIFSIFSIILLLLNKEHEKLIRIYPPLLIFYMFAQATISFSIGSLFTPISFLFYGTLGIIIIRYSIEKFNFVNKEKFVYITPAVIILSLVVFFMLSMFVDFFSDSLQSITNLFSAKNVGPVAYTVSENHPGNFDALRDNAGTYYSASVIPQLGFIAPLFSPWLLMFLGILVLLFSIYKTRNWLLLIPLIWVIASVWGMFFRIRLVFLIGPPIALLAGYFLSELLQKLREIKLGTEDKQQALTFGIGIFLILLFIINFSSAYAFTSSLGPTICFPQKQVLIGGEKCLEINEDGSFTYAKGQPWYDAMTFMREQTPQDSTIITWWDFGYWFQERGKRSSVADGGRGDRPALAKWFTADVSEWNNFTPYMKEKRATHVLMDNTLIGKYGAITAIATEGKRPANFLQFASNPNEGRARQQNNMTILEYSAGSNSIWIPTLNGTFASAPIFFQTQGNQVVGQAYIDEICTKEGITKFDIEGQDLGGCVAFSQHGVHYIPEQEKNNIFVNLMFMEGAALPVEKLFDNGYIQIYEIEYE